MDRSSCHMSRPGLVANEQNDDLNLLCFCLFLQMLATTQNWGLFIDVTYFGGGGNWNGASMMLFEHNSDISWA